MLDLLNVIIIHVTDPEVLNKQNIGSQTWETNYRQKGWGTGDHWCVDERQRHLKYHTLKLRFKVPFFFVQSLTFSRNDPSRLRNIQKYREEKTSQSSVFYDLPLFIHKNIHRHKNHNTLESHKNQIDEETLRIGKLKVPVLVPGSQVPFSEDPHTSYINVYIL